MKSALCFLLFILSLAFTGTASAAEETEFSWPLGPIGGKFNIWTGEEFVRVVEVTPGAPGAAAGLQVGDFITGAFGRVFDPISGAKFDGVVRQLGAAIDHAELNNLALPLMVIRPGTGTLTLNISLPALGALDPAFPLTSAKYAAQYETACAALHARVIATNGNLGYPTGFIGLALLGHPNWNDTTGPKPYRLSVNKVRDWAIAKINDAVLVPVEDKFLDGSANPAYIDAGLENWELGQAVMFFAEYVTKAGETTTYQATLQRGAEAMANRIQAWKQPANGGSADLSYVTTAGATGHGGVVGDYTHQWYVGINMAGVHLFNGLAMAKRAGANMAVRPKDGHYWGLNLNPGDPIPATITDARPASIILPRGAEDTTSGFAGLDNVSAAPLTKVNSPFYYDMSLNQKFWLQWDCLVRSTDSAGFVNYAAVTSSSYDAGGRTPASLVGLLIHQGGTALSAADQLIADKQMAYIVAAHDIQLNCHAYNMAGPLFNALLMPYMTDRDQRYMLDNWKFFYNLSRQPDGSMRYFRGRDWTDSYINETDAMHVDVALPRSVALGGLPHVPGFSSNRIFTRVRQPLLEWPTVAARKLKLAASTTSTSFDLDLIDSSGATIAPTSTSWTVVSGPVTTGILASPTALDTAASFPLPGTYRLRLDATAGALSTYEVIDVEVPAAPIAGYVMGEADYKVYTGISGTTVASLTSNTKFPNAPDVTSTLTQLQGTYSGSNYGSTITCVVVPSVSGSYRFYISSDDESALLFNSSGPSASGATTIASVPGWTGVDEWTYYAAQTSNVVTLTAGQPYYLQARHKEGSGGDHLQIGWTTPTNSTISVIGSVNIARALNNETPAILTQPVSVTTTMGTTVNFSFTVSGPEPRFFQWRRNGVNYAMPGSTPSLTLTNPGAGLAGSWDCVYTNGTSVLTTDAVTLAFSDAGTLTLGGLWQELYTGISGGSVSALTSSPDYLLNTALSGPLAQPSTGSQGDDYGQRWTGWIIPSETASYRFLATGDDGFELSLSPDQYDSHRVVIVTGSVRADMVWSSAAASSYIPLVAGQRYAVQLLHKESGGGDHAAFTWQKQGDAVPTTGSAGLIAATNLQYTTGGTRPDGATAPPLAVADSVGAIINTPTEYDVLANDLDAMPASLSITAVTQPSAGILSIIAAGKRLAYNPGSVPAGSVTASYTITNSTGQFSTATVTINFNQPPAFEANPITGTTAANGVPYVSTLSSSASDPESDAFTFSKVGGPAWLAIAGNGSLSGTPSLDDVGANAFTVQATDSHGNSSQATLNITVLATPTWLNLAGGSWPTATNWQSSLVAGGADGAALFSTLDLTADTAVTLDGARSMGFLVFGDTTASHNWTLSTGTGGPLTLDVTTGTPAIVVNNQTTTISAVLAGSKGLNLSGNGTLTLSGASSYTGTTTINSGKLIIAQANLLNVGTRINVSAAGTLQINANATNGYPSNTIFVDGAGTAATTGLYLNTGVSHNAQATITLQTAPTTIRTAGAGTAQFYGFDSNGTMFSTQASASGSVIASTINIGGGSYGVRFNTLAGANTATGDLTLAGNFLNVGVDNFGLYFQGSGSVLHTGASAAFTNNLRNKLSIITGTLILGGSSTFVGGNYGGQVVFSSNGKLIFDRSGITQTFSGVISGTGSLTKSNTSTLALTNANTYTGSTAISGGTLLANNSTGSATGSGNLTLVAGATLGGSGSVSGSLATSGIISPGASAGSSIGNLSTGAITTGSTASIDWQISDWNGSAGSGYDQITATSLNLSAATTITIVVSPQSLANFTNASSKTFTLITTSAGITGFEASKFFVNASAMTASYFGRWTVSQNGNALLLTYSPPTLYDQWKASNNLTAMPDNAPTIHPGIDIMGAYAFGLSANSGPPQTVSWTVSNSGAPAFEYRRRKAPHGLIFTERTSSDLVNWSTGQLTLQSTTDDGNGTTETVRLSPTTPGEGRLFFRVDVTEAP